MDEWEEVNVPEFEALFEDDKEVDDSILSIDSTPVLKLVKGKEKEKEKQWIIFNQLVCRFLSGKKVWNS